MALTPRPGILEIAPYVAGISQLEGVAKIIKLSSNEGPFGPSPKAAEAAAKAARTMHRYPDGKAFALRSKIGAAFNLDPAKIICGAGSDELLQLLVKAYAGPGDEVLYSRYGFQVYPIAALSAGAKPVAADEVHLTVSVDNLLQAVTERTRIVFVTNPSNPTGTYLPASEIRRLKEGLPENVLLVVDAAYAEFCTAPDFDSAFDLVQESENVVVTRTFSKIYALGGMRLGWAYGSTAIIDVLNRIRGPFNVSSLAMAAGIAALEDQEFVEKTIQHVALWRVKLAEALAAIGLDPVPTQGNFLLVRFPMEEKKNAKAADAFLKTRGIIVRALESYHLPDSLRITIGTEDEMNAVIAALSDFMGQK